MPHGEAILLPPPDGAAGRAGDRRGRRAAARRPGEALRRRRHRPGDGASAVPASAVPWVYSSPDLAEPMMRPSRMASASPCTPWATSAWRRRSRPSRRPRGCGATTTTASASSTAPSPRARRSDMAALGADRRRAAGLRRPHGPAGRRGAVRRRDLDAVRRDGARRHAPRRLFGRSVRHPRSRCAPSCTGRRGSPAREPCSARSRRCPTRTWLRAYTAGAAYAGGQEHERGTLTPGKRADLVVLEGDLDAEHPPRVAQTWMAGELVYRRRRRVSHRAPASSRTGRDAARRSGGEPSRPQSVSRRRQCRAVVGCLCLFAVPGLRTLPPMGSTFGQVFRVTTFGESHGGGVGVVVDGCPPRLPLSCRRDSARPRSAPARPEHDHHAA